MQRKDTKPKNEKKEARTPTFHSRNRQKRSQKEKTPLGQSLPTDLDFSRMLQSQETLQPDETQTHVATEHEKSQGGFKLKRRFSDSFKGNPKRATSSFARSNSNPLYLRKDLVPEVNMDNNSIVDS